MNIRNSLLSVFIMGTAAGMANAAEETSNINSYLPQFHGTVKARYELEFTDMKSRFQVANARLSAVGHVGPIVNYTLQVDLCSSGSFKVLDAWAGIQATSWLNIQAGQQLKPFAIQACRSPHLQYFANKSYISKQADSARGVGLKLRSIIPGSTAYVEAGAFNSHGMSNHTTFGRDLTYAGKVGYTLQEVKAEVGAESMVPDSVRANLWDCLLEWNHCRWTVEGEYTGKHYVHDSYKTIHAYSILANYRLPLHKSVFNQLSFQGRWDGLTDHSNGIRNAAGWLYGNDKARNRITVGTTLSYIKSPIRADIRLNYEKMFYHDGYEPGDGNRDKLLMEFVVRF